MKKGEVEDKSGGLFDYLKIKLRARTWGELAEMIGTQQSIISEIRHGKREVNSVMLVRICNIAEISLKKAQTLIAYREKK